MSFLTNIKTLWAIIIVLIIVNIVSVGSIWYTREHRSFDRRGNYARSERTIEQSRDQHFIPKRLNFSNDQQENFDSLAAIHRENLNQKIDEIRELREQLVARNKNLLIACREQSDQEGMIIAEVEEVAGIKNTN